MPGSLYSSANLLLSVICRFYLTLRYTVFDVVDVEKSYRVSLFFASCCRLNVNKLKNIRSLSNNRLQISTLEIF